MFDSSEKLTPFRLPSPTHNSPEVKNPNSSMNNVAPVVLKAGGFSTFSRRPNLLSDRIRRALMPLRTTTTSQGRERALFTGSSENAKGSQQNAAFQKHYDHH